MEFETDQEKFWAGEFGHDYISRNNSEKLLTSNIIFWSKILKITPNLSSIVELGCNIGLNLKALNHINSSFNLNGYEINQEAALTASSMKIANIENKTILEPILRDEQFDLSFTKGVLIHINPDHLHKVYANLYNLSRRYILICEYYNPEPVTINYRGHKDRLFKRDFARDLVQKYNLTLIDYGFLYRGDYYFPQDDITWFLMEKK